MRKWKVKKSCWLLGEIKFHAKAVAMETNYRQTVQFDNFLACRGIMYFKSCHQIMYQIEEDTDLVWGSI